MIERPILFRPENVRAILDNRKSQTRRVMKPQPQLIKGDLWTWKGELVSGGKIRGCLKVVYQPGDLLWVREKWAQGVSCVVYAADYIGDDPEFVKTARWKSSIHMPRWASRLTLEIVNVCVERVQDISTHDIGAEGINLHDNSAGGFAEYLRYGARNQFIDLWNSINAKHGYGWDKNPWCWRITFRRMRPNTYRTTIAKAARLTV